MAVTLLSPGYFCPTDYFYIYYRAEEVLWEHEDHYQKQTYRTRQYIYGANGVMLLNIPVKHSRDRQKDRKYKNIKIDYDTPWQRIHWKSLQNAYLSAPYFEYYSDEVKTLYTQKTEYLMDFNLRCFALLNSVLDIHKKTDKTTRYIGYYEAGNTADYRNLIQAKRSPVVTPKPYLQVFQEKHGFQPNLSVLDLLFNYGPESISYIKSLTLKT